MFTCLSINSMAFLLFSSTSLSVGSSLPFSMISVSVMDGQLDIQILDVDGIVGKDAFVVVQASY